MNISLLRMLNSIYRKEPISSFVLTVGIVDAAIGGFDSQWSLFSFGLGTIGVAVALRWWQIQRRPEPIERVAVHVLPARASRPPLPLLSAAKKQPPG
ncbi:MAG: hypothetical protein KME16_23220 [Scytolyngbya sp. HA4215-MV1]|jgi:hypothetical protein|nr:hypothetical protein [Scytolyngbya sp. HA4215-MV1]